MINGTGDHCTVEEMRLTDKSEGEQQLKPNNSDAPNEDQREEVQQQEERTPVGQRTQRAGTQPSRCQLPSRTTPTTSTNGRVNLLGVLPWPMQWISSPYQLPDVLQFYPEFLLVFKESFHDTSHCLKIHVKEIVLPILLHLSALSSFYFYLPVLPLLLFLYFFTRFVILLLIILFILIFS
ncbi:transmembrane protein 31 isoform X2 [Lemur catta]|uniref:transmembrane protein 31 isoform X2 n=1 Tax=Lemur catta TaxID=9447 RepID=UPI001E26CEC7|nr:transmembrane protein 31 isoform X2 [Lemur catta]XP_045394251.1 transmembrane protein 31 isoform X2 [Lemur catta]